MNEEAFWNARHAQVLVEWWRRQYNEERPHSALSYWTLQEFAEEGRSGNESTPVLVGG